MITGGGNITRFAASAAMIANSLSGQPSLNVRDMRASAKLHKAEPGRSSRKVAASRLFLCLCRDCRSTAEHRQIGQKSVSKRCVFQGKSRLYGLPRTAAISFPYPAQTGIFVSFWCAFFFLNTKYLIQLHLSNFLAKLRLLDSLLRQPHIHYQSCAYTRQV